jgi:hypothetical protein
MFDTFLCLLSGELVACAGKKNLLHVFWVEGWRGAEGKGREGMYSKRERMNEIL